MKIEKLSTKLIKPFVPTPPTLRHYKTSFIDEFVPFINVGVVLFFAPNRNDHHNPKLVAKLEKSLAKALTRFYPLAGRYVDETQTVDCSDQGAEFTHAKVKIKLQEIHAPEVDVKFVDEFIPYKMGAVDRFSDPLLATQVTMFECGGVAIGASAAHKIADASSLSTFLNSWATINREGSEIDFTGPGFNSSSLFPGRCFRAVPIENISDEMSRKYIRKRYSFSESAILKMKTKAIANGNISSGHCSKVQLVSAIIWKAHIEVDKSRNNNPRESVLLQPISLRGKMASSIAKDSCGNLWVFCPTKAGTEETKTQELVNSLSNNIKKTINNYSKVCHDSEEGQGVVLSSFAQTSVLGSANVITVTSWCKFPFYEADFGFGKPNWAAPGCVPFKNSACSMDDAQGNGVDAHVLLDVKDVSFFEEALEQEVKSFLA